MTTRLGHAARHATRHATRCATRHAVLPRHLRPFHAAPSMAQQSPAWLSRVCSDTAEAPRLFKHTPASKASSTSTARNDHRVYIVGAGNLGRLFAAALARKPSPPPVTFVVHRAGLLDAWDAKPGLVLHPPGYLQSPETQRAEPIVDGVDVEMWTEQGTSETPEISPISNLVIATKAQDALPTVDRLRRYLAPGASVAFLQNGMNKLWPPYGDVYSKARFGQQGQQSPHWLACVVTHGVLSLGPFASVHASPAGVVMGSVGGGADDGPSSLGQTLLDAPELNAQWVPRPELWLMQVEKLVVNAVINPLTAILRCKNGVLFGCFDDAHADADADSRQTAALADVIDRLLREASAVLTALAEHEMRAGGVLASSDADMAAIVDRLSFPRLRAMVYRVGGVVRDNTSSMLQDVAAGKGTEVREFNGWLVDMAEYLGSTGTSTSTGSFKANVATHRAMVDLVEAGRQLDQKQLGDAILR